MDQSQSQPDCGDGAQKMLKTFRGIMNKLTPEKFEALMKRVDEIKIDNEETLAAVVKLIIEKALFDESHSMLYAKMCHHMKDVKVISQSIGVYTTLHRLLMRQCQRGFESELLNDKETQMTAAQNEAESQHWMQEQNKDKAHDRLGIVRFIGELFNLNMVMEPVIHSCAVTLIKDERESSLECLCKLLSTIGEGLDTEAGRPKLNSYFGYVCNLLRENKTSIRLRCILWDLYDLRKNKWVPRKREEVPKTKEVHQGETQLGKGEPPQLRNGIKQVGRKDAGRVAGKEEKSSSDGCGGSRKELSECESSPTPRPQENKCSSKRDIKARSEGEPVAVQQDVKQVGKGEQPQFRNGENQEGGKDAGRVANNEKSSSNGCGGSRKELSQCESSPTPRPQGRKCSRKRNNMARSEREPVAVQQEEQESTDQAKCASRETVERRNSSVIVAEEERHPSEAAPISELTVKEDCDEGDVYETLKRLLSEKSNNSDIEDWIQNNLNTKQRSTEDFVKALMRSVAESVIVVCGVKVDARELLLRAGLLRKYISNEQQQLLALDVLKELMINMKHPRCLLRMFFDLLLDADVIKDTTFFRWELSADAATLASLSSFFSFLQKAIAQLAL